MGQKRRLLLRGKIWMWLLLGSFLCAGSLKADWTLARAEPDLEGLRSFRSKGCSSLAIGVPYENVGTINDAGQVHVLESEFISQTARLTPHYPPFFNQDSVDAIGYKIEDEAEVYDMFGYALAMGDFNADGYDDLAIGAPYETLGTANSAGAVQVLYGSSNYLSAENDYLWHQGSSGMLGVVEADDRFGFALAVGDFDGDGYDDLAIGVPYEDLTSPTVVDGGLVQVMYGSSVGLDDPGNQLWYQNADSVLGDAEESELFGYSLASGNFNNDSFDDLAVGAPYDNCGADSDAGGVNVFYGSSDGLDAVGDLLLNQDFSDIQDTCEANDHFGKALATGDFNGDGRDDLAIGAPDEDAYVVDDCGLAAVLYGSGIGLTAYGNEIFLTATEDEMNLGKSLAVGDFDGDGYDDLAVGEPGLDIGPDVDTGAVKLLYGSSSGLASDLDWHQNRIGITENEAGDRFGYSLAAGDFNCDMIDDLAIGVPYKNTDTLDYPGMVIEIRGSKSGITASGAKEWHQGDSGIGDELEAMDTFGFSLASKRIDWKMLFLPVSLR